MGQTLSEPITAKESSALQNKKVKVGSSSMQGWRITMEDAHTHILTMADDRDASFFAVYDGHGGSKVASYVSRHLHRLIVRRPEYRQKHYEEAITRGFLECDEKMRHEECLKDEMSGSTAITALMRGTDLYVGNVGDSRCIASIQGIADPLSTDHKPGDPLEKERIINAGGFVEQNRVNGNLALSRAVGDFAFKQNANMDPEDQIVSGCPDVVSRTISESWEFMVLACDGIWDVLSNQQVVDFIIKRIASGLEPEVICEELMTRCLATDNNMCGLGCDNMTVILVCFLHDQPYQRLIDRCTDLLRSKEEHRKKIEDEETSTDEADNFVDATPQKAQKKKMISKKVEEINAVNAKGDKKNGAIDQESNGDHKDCENNPNNGSNSQPTSSVDKNS